MSVRVTRRCRARSATRRTSSASRRKVCLMLALVTGRSHRQDRAMPCVRFAPFGHRRPADGERRRLGYPPRQNQTLPRLPFVPARYFLCSSFLFPALFRHSRCPFVFALVFTPFS